MNFFLKNTMASYGKAGSDHDPCTDVVSIKRSPK